MIRRLFSWCAPDDAFRGIGLVGWRAIFDDPGRLIATGGMCAPVVGLYGIGDAWPGHERWPWLSELPRVFVQRGGIRFA